MKVELVGLVKALPVGFWKLMLLNAFRNSSRSSKLTRSVMLDALDETQVETGEP